MSLILTEHHSLLLLSFVFAASYLCGSVPYGLLLGKKFGLGDIRHSGSGNIGATNMLRVGGKQLALLTLLLDGLKGTAPVLVARYFHQDFAVVAAFGAFIGHLFPVWLRFKGGKGVATALGIAFAFSGKLGLVLCLVWLATALISRYSSLAALTAFGFAPIAATVITGNYQIILTMMLLAIAVWIRHHENIRRLIKDTESKIDFGKKA